MNNSLCFCKFHSNKHSTSLNMYKYANCNGEYFRGYLILFPLLPLTLPVCSKVIKYSEDNSNDKMIIFLHFIVPVHEQYPGYSLCCRFAGLSLSRCSLSASEVDQLVKELRNKKFTTVNEGETRAIA